MGRAYGAPDLSTPMTSSLRSRLVVGALGVLAIAVAVGGCGGGGGGGGGGPPASPFFVSSVSPADGANGVPVASTVTVTLSLPIAPQSVAANAVVVGNVEQGAVPGTTGLASDGSGRTLVFAPNAPFPGSTTWSIVVSTALRSTGGDALGGKTTFIFRTASAGGGGPVIPPPSALRATTGRLGLGRRDHTATLLADGTVLVAGGFVVNATVTDRAERFLPSTETFSTYAARMSHPRAGHTATRLADGRVLLCGGWYEVSSGTLNVTDSAEVFDPATGTFTAVGPMTVPRVDHAALRLPDGRVLVTGGSVLQGSFLADHASVEVFDPATGGFTAWALPMSHSRAAHALVDLLDGRWLLVGGSDVDLRPEVFHVATGTFSPFAAAANDRARFGAAAARFASGNVSVVGGEAAGDVLFFDRALTALRNTGSSTTRPRAYATATRIAADRVLVAGGIDYANGGFVLSTCDLVVEGGPAGSDTYATDLRFPTGMADHTATVLSSGAVLFCGGLNPTGGQPAYDGAYLFTP